MPASGFFGRPFWNEKSFYFCFNTFQLGSVFCALSQNLTHLVISRVIQGVGGSLMTPVGKLALIKTFERNELLKAMNFAIIPALIGPVLGPLVGGYMVDYLSWHWIFLINIPIGLLGIILGLKYMPNYNSRETDFDLKGFLIFAAASLLLSISLELFGDMQNITPVLLIFILGFLFLYYYYYHAKRDGNPIFPLNLFQVRTFRVGIVGNLATRLGISSVPLLLPLMIQIAYNQSAVTSGWIIAPMAITAMFGKSSVLKILNKYGYKKTLMVNTFIIGVLICCLAIPNINSSLFWFVPIIAVLGFFNSIQFTSMNTISIADLRNFQTSSGNSLISVNQQLAIGFGIAFGLIVLKSMKTARNSSNMKLTMLSDIHFLTVGILTILSSLVFRRLHVFDGKNMRSSEE